MTVMNIIKFHCRWLMLSYSSVRYYYMTTDTEKIAGFSPLCGDFYCAILFIPLCTSFDKLFHEVVKIINYSILYKNSYGSVLSGWRLLICSICWNLNYKRCIQLHLFDVFVGAITCIHSFCVFSGSSDWTRTLAMPSVSSSLCSRYYSGMVVYSIPPLRTGKGKTIPVRGLGGPWVCKTSRLPYFF
jgi:hypothetical protein